MNKLLKELLDEKESEKLDEKLDKVGKADKDIDNDGDVDDSDEYLANRRKKISAEIKKDKEKYDK